MVDDAASLMTEGCFFAKVDLRNAYRSVSISEFSQQVTGLSWIFNSKTVYMKDTKLPLGLVIVFLFFIVSPKLSNE